MTAIVVAAIEVAENQQHLQEMEATLRLRCAVQLGEALLERNLIRWDTSRELILHDDQANPPKSERIGLRGRIVVEVDDV